MRVCDQRLQQNTEQMGLKTTVQPCMGQKILGNFYWLQTLVLGNPVQYMMFPDELTAYSIFFQHRQTWLTIRSHTHTHTHTHTHKQEHLEQQPLTD